MSIYSTVRITRSRAVEMILDDLTEKMKEVLKIEVSEMSDKEIESKMDRLLEPRLYNAWVVSDDAEDEPYRETWR